MERTVINGTNVIVSPKLTKELFDVLNAHYGNRFHWFDVELGYNFPIPESYDYSTLDVGVEINAVPDGEPCGLFWLGYNGKYTLDV